MFSLEVNQSALKGGQRVPYSVYNRIEREVKKVIGKKAKGSISIAFVSDAQIKKMNKAYRGKDAVTDVLSFELEGEELGEVIISYNQAKKQAKVMKHSVRDEIVFLLVHGILHVFGHDHMKPAEKKRMFALQTRILTALGVNPQV